MPWSQSFPDRFWRARKPFVGDLSAVDFRRGCARRLKCPFIIRSEGPWGGAGHVVALRPQRTISPHYSRMFRGRERIACRGAFSTDPIDWQSLHSARRWAEHARYQLPARRQRRSTRLGGVHRGDYRRSLALGRIAQQVRHEARTHNALHPRRSRVAAEAYSERFDLLA